MSVFSLETYLKSIEKHLETGSERSHYPALKALLDNPQQDIEAVIEEKGNKAGIPDFTVKQRSLLLGYVEAKEVGIDLDQVEKTEQLKRYLESFSNFILTNYLEFRWYMNGKRRLKESLADRSGEHLQIKNIEKVTTLLDQFLSYTGEIINSPEDLARQMARLTKAIRLATLTVLEDENKSGELHQLKQGFSEVLLPDLTDANFADMYAQTISYGLFAARVGHAQNPSEAFTRRTAATYIPATNPFLKRLFNTIVETEVMSQIDWAIDDLVQLLSQVNMASILEHFGKRTHQEDPVVHFYETFLAAYNAALRKSRGVYYTPEPVVSFIVRSIDFLLKERFDLPLGLADNGKDPKNQAARVQILDPATGTGTFLYEVVKQIYRNLEDIGMANQWNSYVRDNLLNRMFGFELLMAPYAIAHLKLGLELQELGYQFEGKQRLGIYLTNTLDEALKKSEVLFGQFVAQEANEASAIKRDFPVMVVLGNPPYSYQSSNTGNWIQGLVRDYYQVDGQDLGEKNSKGLQDDYVKFIRFGQWRVSKTGYGILAFITNHGYLDNPTFRGMRQNLMQTFTDIYILDLHGNAKKREVSPSGSPDRNVFDIQQGVSIGIFVKEPQKNTLAQVHHAELWGDRLSKYQILNNSSFDDINWKIIIPQAPLYLFCPQNTDLLEEYENGWRLADIMPVYSSCMNAARNSLVIDFEQSELVKKFQKIIEFDLDKIHYLQTELVIKNTKYWNFYDAAKSLKSNKDWKQSIIQCLYSPFDTRLMLYDLSFIDRPRTKVNQNMMRDNISFVTTRQTKEPFSILATNLICCQHKISAVYDRSYFIPLYLYEDIANGQGNLFYTQTANISEAFLKKIQEKLGYVPAPELIFYYIYAILHSPTYRQRYAEFLKVDFPCVPFTSNDRLFRSLGEKGQELVELHLMKSKQLNKLITKIGGEGDNSVSQVTYQPTEQRVYINNDRYVEGITPDLWNFKVGGYQVLEKWLKDRKKAKRILSFDDLLHYQKIVVALKETMRITIEIDQLIPHFPLE